MTTMAFCEHANEAPRGYGSPFSERCKCPTDCACRLGMCAAQSANLQRFTAPVTVPPPAWTVEEIETTVGICRGDVLHCDRPACSACIDTERCADMLAAFAALTQAHATVESSNDRAEVQDKLSVHEAAGQSPFPVKRAIVQKQCEDFLVARFTALRTELAKLKHLAIIDGKVALDLAAQIEPLQDRVGAAEFECKQLRAELAALKGHPMLATHLKRHARDLLTGGTNASELRADLETAAIILENAGRGHQPKEDA